MQVLRERVVAQPDAGGLHDRHDRPPHGCAAHGRGGRWRRPADVRQGADPQHKLRARAAGRRRGDGHLGVGPSQQRRPMHGRRLGVPPSRLPPLQSASAPPHLSGKHVIERGTVPPRDGRVSILLHVALCMAFWRRRPAAAPHCVRIDMSNFPPCATAPSTANRECAPVAGLAVSSRASATAAVTRACAPLHEVCMSRVPGHT